MKKPPRISAVPADVSGWPGNGRRLARCRCPAPGRATPRPWRRSSAPRLSGRRTSSRPSSWPTPPSTLRPWPCAASPSSRRAASPRPKRSSPRSSRARPTRPTRTSASAGSPASATTRTRPSPTSAGPSRPSRSSRRRSASSGGPPGPAASSPTCTTSASSPKSATASNPCPCPRGSPTASPRSRGSTQSVFSTWKGASSGSGSRSSRPSPTAVSG